MMWIGTQVRHYLRVEITHVFHESNFCADALAKRVHDVPLGVCFISLIPSYLHCLWLADQGVGVS